MNRRSFVHAAIVSGIRVLFLLSAFALSAANADVPDRADLIARMREAAVHYSDRLQDFICTQITRRSADTTGSGEHWKPLEVQELELSYVAHKENYVFLKVDGKSVEPEKRIKRGYAKSRGEFGSILRMIFDPKVNANFTWDHEETRNGNRLCVFRYQVRQAASTWVMTFDSDRLKVGHDGFVYADCESGSLARIQIEAEPASLTRNGQQIAMEAQLNLRYRPTLIGANEFLLPESAEEISRNGNTLTKAEIQFRDYRKFQADSKITFDSQDTKPEKVPELQR